MSCDQPHEPVGHAVHEVDEHVRLVRVEQVQQDPEAEEDRGDVGQRVHDQGEAVRATTAAVAHRAAGRGEPGVLAVAGVGDGLVRHVRVLAVGGRRGTVVRGALATVVRGAGTTVVRGAGAAVVRSPGAAVYRGGVSALCGIRAPMWRPVRAGTVWGIVRNAVAGVSHGRHVARPERPKPASPSLHRHRASRTSCREKVALTARLDRWSGGETGREPETGPMAQRFRALLNHGPHRC